jgi:3-isopropylmalate dehydrogenase
MLPSASLDSSSRGMYEPCHGSAPDIANQNIANPLAMISSLSMALKFSLQEEKLSEKIDRSVKAYIKNGYRTKDIAAGETYIKTSEVADIIIERLKNE